jgi:hypothetical protein
MAHGENLVNTPLHVVAKKDELVFPKVFGILKLG